MSFHIFFLIYDSLFLILQIFNVHNSFIYWSPVNTSWSSVLSWSDFFGKKIILLHYHHHHHHHHHLFVLCGNDLAIATGSYCFALFLVIGEPLLIWKRLQGIRMFFWRIMEISHRQFRVGKIGPPFLPTAQGIFLGRSNVFTRESAMLKLQKKGENGLFLSSPSPLSFFRPSTYTKGRNFYSPIFRYVKSKMAATTIRT